MIDSNDICINTRSVKGVLKLLYAQYLINIINTILFYNLYRPKMYSLYLHRGQFYYSGKFFLSIFDLILFDFKFNSISLNSFNFKTGQVTYVVLYFKGLRKVLEPMYLTSEN